MSSKIPYAGIMKEEGVADLPNLKCRGAFAKALWLEQQAGHTTPEAEAELAKAIEAEAQA